MFEIRCLVGDKKLAEALRALGGLTLEPPVTLPVGGPSLKLTKAPTIENGHDTEASAKGNKAKDHLIEFLKSERPKQVKAATLSGYLMSKGFQKNGYSYAVKQLIEDGFLKKTRTVGQYDVVP